MLIDHKIYQQMMGRKLTSDVAMYLVYLIIIHLKSILKEIFQPGDTVMQIE